MLGFLKQNCECPKILIPIPHYQQVSVWCFYYQYRQDHIDSRDRDRDRDSRDCSLLFLSRLSSSV